MNHGCFVRTAATEAESLCLWGHEKFRLPDKDWGSCGFRWNDGSRAHCDPQLAIWIWNILDEVRRSTCQFPLSFLCWGLSGTWLLEQKRRCPGVCSLRRWFSGFIEKATLSPESKQFLRGKQVCLMHYCFSLMKMYRYKNGEEGRKAVIYLEFQIPFGKCPPLGYYSSDSLGNWRLFWEWVHIR